MLRRFVRIVSDTAAAAAGAVIGANAGQDAYDYVKSGRASRDLKRGVAKLTSQESRKPVPLPRKRPDVWAKVPCPECAHPLEVPAGEPNISVLCGQCQVRSLVSSVDA
jgi:hypothetical protein